MKSMSGLTAWAWLFCDFCLFHSEDSPSAPQTNAVGLKGATLHYLLVAAFPIHSLLSIGIATTLPPPCHFSPGWQPEPRNDLWTCSCPRKHTLLTVFHSASSGMCRQTQTCCLAPLASPGSPWIHHSLDPTLHPFWPPVSSLDMLAPFSYLGCYLWFPLPVMLPAPCTLPAWAPSHLQTLNIVGLHTVLMERPSLLGLTHSDHCLTHSICFIELITMCNLYLLTCLLSISPCLPHCLLLPPPTSWSSIRPGFCLLCSPKYPQSQVHLLVHDKGSMPTCQISGWMDECSGIFVSSCPSTQIQDSFLSYKL